MKPIYDEITALTDSVCRQHLDEEYAQLARKMTAALARKRPSPLENNPFAWWVSVNGLVTDARELPLAVQEHLAREGIIPFVPSKKLAEQNKNASEHPSSDSENQEEKPQILHFKIEPV